MKELKDLEEAVAFDTSLKFAKGSGKELLNKYLKPATYSKKKLYDSMFQGKTVVFRDYPLKLIKKQGESTGQTLVRMLQEGLPQDEKIKIRAGASRTLINVSIEETIKRWQGQRSKFGVTDLHFRGTKFYRQIDARSISYFNLLPNNPYEVSFLEMLTLVISSRGIFSDSHSDDGDGSNHCFVGRKLWLAWDREEGKKYGLQDCTHDTVHTQAAFNMKAFAALKSSHWFIVSENQTLFMPGNFTHKVITLEPYIGFGSFYVSFPNYFNSLKRWILREVGDVSPEFLNRLNAVCRKRAEKLNDKEKEELGYHYLRKGLKTWRRGLRPGELANLAGSETFNALLDLARTR